MPVLRPVFSQEWADHVITERYRSPDWPRDTLYQRFESIMNVFNKLTGHEQDPDCSKVAVAT